LARNVATVHVAKAKKLNKEHLDLVREVARNKDKHWASRLAAIFVLGKSGDDADRKWIRDLYPNEDNVNVKRAIAVSLHSLPKPARNKFYSAGGLRG